MQSPQDVMRAFLAANPSPLEDLYKSWVPSYLGRGGDSKAVVVVGHGRALSTELGSGEGRIELNFLSGAVSAEVKGLAGRRADLWLVETAPGTSAMPEKGDRFVRVGELAESGDGVARVAANLGPNFFRDFSLDLVVVSRAGSTPEQSIILLGSRSYFERLFTKNRLAAERTGKLASAVAKDLAPFVNGGQVSQQIADGADLFFRGTFSGNSRTCATCHRVNDNQTIDPPFIATLPGNDPLFISELPAAQGGVPNLEIPILQRDFGLIRENVDGFQNLTTKFVMRGVPHTLSLATSITAPADGRAPVQRTGWGGDGAPGNGSLRLFPVGAVTQHFTKSLNRIPGVDFVLPTSAQLDAMAAFMLSSGRLNELDLAKVKLNDAGAEAGRLTFNSNGQCFNCHNNAGANTPPAGSTPASNGNFNTGIDTVPHPARAIVAFPNDGGFGTTPANPDGTFGDGTFNVPPLVEAASTPPFFHNNVFSTIEQAVSFYSGPNFAASPSGQFLTINLTPAETNNVAAFLRVINASFNGAIAIQRLNTALAIENGVTSGTTTAPAPTPTLRLQTVNALLSLADTSNDDVVTVLQDRGLNPGAVSLVRAATGQIDQALASTDHATRVSLMQSAITNLTNARAEFGTGLSFTLGEGNVLF